MRRLRYLSIVTIFFCGVAAILLSAKTDDTDTTSSQTLNWSEYEGYTGSLSCRECHQRFHHLWNTSFHGSAMQPFTPELAREKLQPQKKEIRIKDYGYKYEFDGEKGYVVERGPTETKKYRILHTLGGKNVFYFLTLLERGKLQTLPIAYDVRRCEWYDMAASGVRHFLDMPDEPIYWTEWPYTFNTACYNCHVSQLSKNYAPETDTYSTTWIEPGINCETCHGPCEEHNRICRETPEGQLPEDLKITVVMQDHGFTAHQVNAACSGCHAKMVPITTAFVPGDDFFQHYDITTLEHHDFYPDGRDLGENYTYTLWRMSPCVKASNLDCIHCHTSSGRYRFHERTIANNACMPCHEDRVREVASHSHHPADSEASKCISCHMPMTEFARMRRSDHSMRPPMPAASIAFKSPNACNICHTDKNAEWANAQVRKWHSRDYQKPVIEVASLIKAGRENDWSLLSEMLEYLNRRKHDEIFANSLVRLLRFCNDDRKWKVLIDLAKHDPSPLVRSSALDQLGGVLTPDKIHVLLSATHDEFRLVRIRAATSLAPVPSAMLKKEDREALDKATQEYLAAMRSRPDDALAHYNLGNFFAARGEYEKALDSYTQALNLLPGLVQALVNVSIVYNAMGQNERAEQSLRKATEIAPDNVPALLNLAMLLGEMKKMEDAEQTFRKVLELDSGNAPAAYNLGIILSKREQLDDGIAFLRKASELEPTNAKYSYSLAFYLHEKGDVEAAIKVLNEQIQRDVNDANIYFLLGDIYEKRGKLNDALGIYKKGMKNPRLSERDRYMLGAKIREIPTR